MGCSASSQPYPVAQPIGNGSAKPPQNVPHPYPQQVAPQPPILQRPPQQQQLPQPAPPQQVPPQRAVGAPPPQVIQRPPQQQQQLPQPAPPQQVPPQRAVGAPPPQVIQRPPQQQQQLPQPAPPQQVPPQRAVGAPPPQVIQPPPPPEPDAHRAPGAPPPLQQAPSQPHPPAPQPAPLVENAPQQQAAEPPNTDPTPSKTDDPQGIEGSQEENNDESVAITVEDLKQFIEYEKEIRRIESEKTEEQLVINEAQLKNLQTALKHAQEDLNHLRQNTEKEKRDVDNFNLASYMASEKMAIMGPEEARQKEQEEYVEAKNKQDVAEKQVETLNNQINTTVQDLESQRLEVAKLNDLRTKVDGLLENIFNGEYGSELEERLELESEQLLQYKKHISVAHYKWHNGRTLVHHACSQLAYAKRRWEQIQTVQPQFMQARYQMLAEVRGNLIAAHQNIERTRSYLSCNLLYFTVQDSKNLLGSINAIVVDIVSMPTYHRALEWYKYYHYRSALLLNWMNQTINNKIVVDHREASRKFFEKYTELRKERLRCIRERAKGDLGMDIDIADVTPEDAAARIELDIKSTESNLAITMDTAASTTNMADNENPPPPIENKENTMDIPEPPKETSEAGPPTTTIVPLSDLAPPPSSEELFGNITELKETHKNQLADFEKAQSVNKSRMEQGLEEKLRARKSKRRRAKLHEEQAKALAKKYENAIAIEEEPVVPAVEAVLGGDGNPDNIAAVNNNNNNEPTSKANEEAIAPVEETALGKDGVDNTVAL